MNGNDILNGLIFDKSVFMVEYKLKSKQNIIVYNIYCLLSLLIDHESIELMKYNISKQIKQDLLHVDITKIIKQNDQESNEESQEYEIIVNTKYDTKSVANYIDINIPIIKTMKISKFKSSKIQKGKLNIINDTKQILCWKLKQVPGQIRITRKFSCILDNHNSNKQGSNNMIFDMSNSDICYELNGYSTSNSMIMMNKI